MAAEIPDGAVVVARAILNSSLWTMRDQDRILAITCIALCNWRDQKWFDGNRNIVIKRGSFVRSLEDIAEAARLTIKTTRTSLRRLQKSGFLARKSTNRYTLITLPKYEFYQDLSKYYSQPGMLLGTDRAMGGQDPGNKQEGFKGLKRGEAPAAPPGNAELDALVHLARTKTKMPNKPDTIQTNVAAALVRRGEEWTRRWLEDDRNEGRTVLELQDAVKTAPAPPRPAPPKGEPCPECKTIGRVPQKEEREGVMVDVYGECGTCKGRGFLHPKKERANA